MSLNPSSMRYPFETEIANESHGAQQAHRYAFNAILDLNQAVSQLKSQVDTKSTASTSSTSSSSSSSSTVTTASVNAAIASAVSAVQLAIKATFPGNVNNQSGVTAYSTQNSDYGAMIVLDDASPIAVTLNVLSSLPSVSLPFYCIIFNDGAGTATLTPVSGQINGAGSVTIPGQGFGIIYFDGTNFWAAVTSAAGSGVTSLDGITGAITLVAGSGITITDNAPSAGDITIAASGSGILRGTVTVAASGTSGTFRGTGTVTGATTGMTAFASAPALIALCGTSQVSWVCDVASSNTIEVQVTLPNIGPTWGSISFQVAVIP